MTQRLLIVLGALLLATSVSAQNRLATFPGHDRMDDVRLAGRVSGGTVSNVRWGDDAVFFVRSETTYRYGLDDGLLREAEDGMIVIQGVERGRAFSFLIVEETGMVSIAVAREGEGILVFGACTPTPASK